MDAKPLQHLLPAATDELAANPMARIMASFQDGDRDSLLAKSDAKSQNEAKKSFARAIGFLQVYIDKVQQMATQGRAAQESAALLVDYANILIAKLEPLT